MTNTLVHHHYIFHCKVNSKTIDNSSGKIFKQFLLDLVNLIDMEVLIAPQVAFSEHNAWTGLIGIVTSHISFHYWVEEQYLQLDIYSCKSFDTEIVNKFLIDYWKSTNVKALFIKREFESEFEVQKILF